MKTAFELITELLQLEEEELELSKKLAKTNNVSTRAELEKEIDRLFVKELDIIKVLKNTKVNLILIQLLLFVNTYFKYF